MPLPIHSTALPSVQLAAVAECGGVTELRVHGVGGTPPGATLGDLAPEQASGDSIAGFYRSSDHEASEGDRDKRLDVDRHVEVYSWGGLTSQSKVRVLWLALLPPDHARDLGAGAVRAGAGLAGQQVMALRSRAAAVPDSARAEDPGQDGHRGHAA
jgi:hypothetical protein